MHLRCFGAFLDSVRKAWGGGHGTPRFSRASSYGHVVYLEAMDDYSRFILIRGQIALHDNSQILSNPGH